MKKSSFILTFLVFIPLVTACGSIGEESNVDFVEKEEIIENLEMVKDTVLEEKVFSLEFPQELILSQSSNEEWSQWLFKKEDRLFFILSEYKKETTPHELDDIITLVPQVVSFPHKIQQDEIQGHALVKVWYQAVTDLSQAMTSPEEVEKKIVYSYLIETQDSYLLFHFIRTDAQEGLDDLWFEETILSELEVVDFEPEGFDDYFGADFIYLQGKAKDLSPESYQMCSTGLENVAEAYKFEAGDQEMKISIDCSLDIDIASFDSEKFYKIKVVPQKPDDFPSAVDHLYLVGREVLPEYWGVEILER